jgi:probable F420-dependent oxidoreductase
VKLATTLTGPLLGSGERLAELPALAAEAEALGIDQLGVPDHVLLGEALGAYPYGRFPEPPTCPYPEPMTVLAAVAAVTRRIELAPSTLIAPARPAPLLAKTAATLDRLSSGRLVLGVGTGWHEAELRASGVDPAGRGDRMDDTMRACRVLWRDSPASFSSPTVSFDAMHCEPRPLSPDSIRILVGGGNLKRAVARVRDYADGWMPPPSIAAAELAEGVAMLREACSGAGRDPARLEVKVWLPVPAGELERTLAERLPALRDAGATVVQVAAGPLAGTADRALPALERLCAAFAPYR